MLTARIWSPALADASRWLTGQIPQIRPGNAGHFAERPAFAELFETAKLGDVESRVRNAAGFIQLNGDFGVTLDAGDGVYDNSIRHNLTSSKLDVRADQFDAFSGKHLFQDRFDAGGRRRTTGQI